MWQEYIEIRGARKIISRRLATHPETQDHHLRRRLGFRKIVNCVATEAQRQMNENFSMFIRTFLPRYSQPDADAIENRSMPIVVDQKRLGGGSHSTMGTITDIPGVAPFVFPHQQTARGTCERLLLRYPKGSEKKRVKYLLCSNRLFSEYKAILFARDYNQDMANYLRARYKQD